MEVCPQLPGTRAAPPGCSARSNRRCCTRVARLPGTRVHRAATGRERRASWHSAECPRWHHPGISSRGWQQPRHPRARFRGQPAGRGPGTRRYGCGPPGCEPAPHHALRLRRASRGRSHPWPGLRGHRVTPCPRCLMRVRALIVEDEPIARQRLRALIADTEWLECVGEAENGPAALRAIDALQPELVFLDIELPEMSGLEVLERITHQPLIIFTTAYSKYAVAAFELEALDYLVKPFGPERFSTALERVRKSLKQPDHVAPLERAREG